MNTLRLKHASTRIGAAVLYVVLPVGFVLAWGITLAGRGPGRSDFWTFWLASRTVLHGGNPYPAIESLPHVADKWFAPFVYPPVAAFLLAPLAVLPYAVATVPGGLPVREGDRVVAGLGIAGAAPDVCHDIAAAVVA